MDLKHHHTRKTSCVNARRIPSASHIRPGAVRWEVPPLSWLEVQEWGGEREGNGRGREGREWVPLSYLGGVAVPSVLSRGWEGIPVLSSKVGKGTSLSCLRWEGVILVLSGESGRGFCLFCLGGSVWYGRGTHCSVEGGGEGWGIPLSLSGGSPFPCEQTNKLKTLPSRNLRLWAVKTKILILSGGRVEL